MISPYLVIAPNLMFIKRYSHVMHIVSQVEGKLSAAKTNYYDFDAHNIFPACTALSGAPKMHGR